MSDTVADIQDRLANQGVGAVTGAGINIFSMLPPSPDNALSVRVMPGRRPARAMGTSTPVVRDYHDIQILVRHASRPGLTSWAETIIAVLDFKTWTAAGGALYFSQLAYQVTDLGEDEKHRPMQSLVFDITRTR
jgi:hypothetical protein